ncbi:MAG: CCA tRNA nucleotidyltransferase [Firmicutes bacterium]|nr:CCA tRNA nucleotidyltransferase [Bacillota bacterium]MDD4693513.1 CCA tRNA nucleotidyltransferase [Bacillota bacterium]
MKLPLYVLDILNTLDKAGFESFVVGGAVRDYLLGKTPYDYDITTSATPKEVIALFPKTTPYGIKFGTVTVLSKEPVEVTTFRKDGYYVDGRRPLEVSFSKKIEEDLYRRDFTVNAIAYSPTIGFYDPVGGKEDLKLKLIRAVGTASNRFAEDSLRILRAVRFLAKLGRPWKIEDETFVAMKNSAHLIKRLSKERITDELIKLIVSESALYGLELLSVITNDAFGASLALVDLDSLPFKMNLRLASLVKANTWLTDWLILPKKTLRYIKKMLVNQPIPENLTDLRHLCFLVGREYLDDWLLLRGLKPKSKEIESHAIFVSDLAISGNDIKHLGKGPQIGTMLDKLAYLVRENQTLNTKEALLKIIGDQKEPS